MAIARPTAGKVKNPERRTSQTLALLDDEHALAGHDHCLQSLDDAPDHAVQGRVKPPTRVGRPMKAPTFALLGVLLLAAPFAASTATYSGVLTVHDLNLTQAAVPMPLSNPVFQSAQQFNINLQPGLTVTATLRWADTSAGQLGGNDLDLTLLLPSAAPVPLPIPPTTATVLAIASSRVARTTCTDSAAESSAHPGGASESISFTVPAGGEIGPYALMVRAFVMTANQPYTVDIHVGDDNGRDLTAARVTQLLGETTLITTNPHCQLI